MLRAFQTVVGPHPALDAWGGLYGRVERRLHAKLSSGQAWKELATTYYEDDGAEALSAKRLEHVARSLLGKRDAARKAAEEAAAVLKIKVAAKDKDVRAKEKRLAKARLAVVKALAKRAAAVRIVAGQSVKLAGTRADGARAKIVARIDQAKTTIADLDRRLEGLRVERDTAAFAVHQGKRRLGVLADRLTTANTKAAQASICFGSRDLFRRQFHLAENGYADHAE